MTEYTVTEWETSAPDGTRYRGRVEYDQLAAEGFADSPRDDDGNVAEIVTWGHDRTGIGDRGLTAGEQMALEYGGWAGLTRHLTRAGALVILPLSGIAHSGISVWIAARPNETSPFDSAGWDSGQWGFVQVTRARWVELMADTDPMAPAATELTIGMGRIAATVPAAESAARSEVETYAAYLRGEIYGWVVERAVTVSTHRIVTWGSAGYREDGSRTEDWELVESCGGYIGEPEYAESEARATITLLTVPNHTYAPLPESERGKPDTYSAGARCATCRLYRDAGLHRAENGAPSAPVAVETAENDGRAN